MITQYPLTDGFETTLKNAYDGGTGAISLKAIPNFAFPSGKRVAIGIDMGKTNAQVVILDSRTNVVSIDVKKDESTNYTAQKHLVGAVVRITDFFDDRKNIVTEIDGKAPLASPVFTEKVSLPNYADDTARDTAITSPTDGMMVFNNHNLQTYNSSTAQRETKDNGTPPPQASETVQGIIQLATTEIALLGEDDEMGMTSAKTKAVVDAIPATTSIVSQFTAGENITGPAFLRYGVSLPGGDVQFLQNGTALSSIGYQTGSDNTNRLMIEQNVITSTPGLFDGLTLSLARVGSPTFNLQGYLLKYDSSGNRVVVATSSNTINSATLGTSYSSHTFTFNKLISSGNYFVGVQAIGTVSFSASNYVNVFGSGFTRYTLLAYSVSVNGTRAELIREIYFIMSIEPYTTENVTKLYQSNTSDDVRSKAIAHTTTSVVTDDVFNGVIGGKVGGYTGLTAGETYYLQDNGTIGLTAGTNSVKVGRAISTTEINFITPL